MAGVDVVRGGRHHDAPHPLRLPHRRARAARHRDPPLKKLALVVAVALALVACAGDDDAASPTTTAPKTTTTTLGYEQAVFDEVTVTRDIAYGSAPGVDGSSQTLLLDLYEPAGDDGVDARPVAVFVHGGGYSIGDKAIGPSAQLARTFATLGYVAVSINYRLLAPRGCTGATAGGACQAAAIGAIHDAQAAVRWLRLPANVKDHRIDPNRIGIGGESAGAITATGVGVWAEEPGTSGNPGEPSGVQAFMSLSGGLPGALFVNAGDAPGLLVSGTADPIVPYRWSVDTNAALERATVATKLLTYDGAGHVPWADHHAEIEQATIDFFHDHVVAHPIPTK